MLAFYLGAAALVIVVLALLLSPWWRRHQLDAADDSAESLVVDIHRERLADLEREQREGRLSATEADAVRTEIQRQLLDETRIADSPPGLRSGRRYAVIVGLAVPLLAIALYARIGTPDAMLPEQERTRLATTNMEQLTASLAKRLAANPGDPEEWAMLARSYKTLERWEEAEQAFRRIGPAIERRADWLAEYAELQVLRDGEFGDRSRDYVARALALDPNLGLALFLGGGDAYESGRFDDAARLWERLLPQLDPESEDAKMIQASLQRIRNLKAPAG